LSHLLSTYLMRFLLARIPNSAKNILSQKSQPNPFPSHPQPVTLSGRPRKMSTFLHFLPPSLCLVLTLAGCASSTPPATSSPVPAPENVTGNWQFEVQIPALPTSGPIVFPTNPIEDIFGSLSSSGKSVSAILHATPLTLPPCVEIDTALAFTGTTDSSGNLSLTAPLVGGVATISANLLTLETVTLPDGTVRNEPFFAGTYQVVGGSCAQPSISLNIFSVSNITGTFTGTATAGLANNPGPPSTITATFVQASAPDTNGKYALSGTITSTGGCNATYSFTSGAVSGSTAQSAYFLSDTLSLPPPNPPVPAFSGSITPATPQASILGAFTFAGCGSSYSGLLNPSP